MDAHSEAIDRRLGAKQTSPPQTTQASDRWQQLFDELRAELSAAARSNDACFDVYVAFPVAVTFVYWWWLFWEPI